LEETILRPGLGVLSDRVNSGFVAGGEGALAVDAMNYPADGARLRDFVARSSPAPLVGLVNTHHHADHTFGNQAFGCAVIASEETRRIMAGQLEGEWSPLAIAEAAAQPGREGWRGLVIRLPAIAFEQRLTVHLGRAPGGGPERRAELELTRGHTTGHATVFLPEEGVLFGGDLFFVGRYPFIRQGSSPAWIAALERIIALGPELLIPGHGPVCDGTRARAEAEGTIAYFRETVAMIKDLKGRGLGREEILGRADEFPRRAGEGYERLHRVNLERLYDESAPGEA
jgi:cyclase